MDHKIVLNKRCALDYPPEIINWMVDFLTVPTVHRELKLPRMFFLSKDQFLHACPGDKAGTAVFHHGNA